MVELGRFLTGFFVVMGIGTFLFCSWVDCRNTVFAGGGRGFCKEERIRRIRIGILLWGESFKLIRSSLTALPVVLAHTEQIRIEAMVMSIIGGLLIYGTIISFTMFFREQEEF